MSATTQLSQPDVLRMQNVAIYLPISSASVYQALKVMVKSSAQIRTSVCSQTHVGRMLCVKMFLVTTRVPVRKASKATPMISAWTSMSASFEILVVRALVASMSVALTVVNAHRDSRAILTEAAVWTLMSAACLMLAESMPFAIIHQEPILVPALRASRAMLLRNAQISTSALDLRDLVAFMQFVKMLLLATTASVLKDTWASRTRRLHANRLM